MEEAIKEFVEDFSNYTKRSTFDKKMKQLEEKLLQRDLEQLNASLLQPLRIKQKNPKASEHKQFPDLYFENTQKAYVKSTNLDKIQPQRQKHSPFVPEHQNFDDTHANSKFLKEKKLFSLNDSSSNFVSILKNSKVSKFNGEAKATFPTIVFEGKDKHPMGGFSNQPQKTQLKAAVQTLGGISDSLKKLGIQSVYSKNRRTLQDNYKTYSSFMAGKMSMSNTNNFVIQPPPVEVKVQLRNPFIREPFKDK